MDGRLTRASLLRTAGAAAAALGLGRLGGHDAFAGDSVSCVLTPEQTEGPYYIAKEKLRRNITDGRPGTPLTLRLARSGMAVELVDVASGLWVWRLEHPAWHEGYDWEPLVTSTVVESGGEVALIDPLAPPEDAAEIWDRLDASPPTMAVILKPDHVRDVDLFAHRYDLRGAYGPYLFWGGDAPRTELEGLEPERELPGGLVTLYDGRGRNETPLWLPEQRALVFADALTAPGGELRVWGTPWHEKRVLPALRELLDLPFEHVIVSHGEPVHDRAAFEQALERPPWAG